MVSIISRQIDSSIFSSRRDIQTEIDEKWSEEEEAERRHTRVLTTNESNSLWSYARTYPAHFQSVHTQYSHSHDRWLDKCMYAITRTCMCSLFSLKKEVTPAQTGYLQVKTFDTVQKKTKSSLFVAIQMLLFGQTSFFKPEHPIVTIIFVVVVVAFWFRCCFLFDQWRDARHRRLLILFRSLRVTQIDKDRLALEEHIDDECVIHLNDRAFQCLPDACLRFDLFHFNEQSVFASDRKARRLFPGME